MALPASKIEQEADTSFPFASNFLQSFFSSKLNKESLTSSLLISAFAVINISLALLISELPSFAALNQRLIVVVDTISVVLAIAAVLTAGSCFLISTFLSLKSGKIGYETCTTIGLIAFSVVVVVEYFSSAPGVTQIALSLALVLFILLLDRAWTNRWHGLFSRRLGGWLWHADGSDHLYENEVNAANLFESGAIIEFFQGEYLPCDGEVISGLAEVLERRYSGLGKHKIRGAGQEVFAGSKVLRGSLKVKLASTPEESVLGYFGTSLEERVKSELPGKRRSSLLESLFSASILFIGACVFLYLKDTGTSFSDALLISSGIFFLTLIPRFFKVSSFWDSAVLFGAFMRGALLKGNYCSRFLERIRTLLIYSTKDFPVGKQAVKEIELIDSRIDLESLQLTLLSLLSCSNDETHTMVVEYLFDKLKSATPYSVDDFRNYPGKGICGVIKDTDFSIGTEDFMIERGVQLQASDVLVEEPSGGIQLIAADDEIIARIHFFRHLEKDGKRMVREQRGLGIRTILASDEDKNRVDKVGKLIDLELSDVNGEVTQQALVEKIKSSKPLALFTSPSIDKSILEQADLSIVMFDELLWDTEIGDVIIFEQDTSIVSSLIKFFRRQLILKKVSIWSASLLSLALGIALVFEALSTLEVVALVCLISAISYSRMSAVIGDRTLS